GQLTASARKYSRRVGDGVPERVAYCELHWDGAAPFAGVNAGAVTIDRLQNHAARIRTAAGAVANRKLPIHVMDIVVASRANAEHRGAWRNRVWRRLRHGSCRITRAGQCDRRDSIAELQSTDTKVNWRWSCVRRVGSVEDLTAISRGNRER